MNDINKNPSSYEDGFLYGASDRNRTGDLILTKDALYQLSHRSITAKIIIAKLMPLVKRKNKIS